MHQPITLRNIYLTSFTFVTLARCTPLLPPAADLVGIILKSFASQAEQPDAPHAESERGDYTGTKKKTTTTATKHNRVFLLDERKGT